MCALSQGLTTTTTESSAFWTTSSFSSSPWLIFSYFVLVETTPSTPLPSSRFTAVAVAFDSSLFRDHPYVLRQAKHLEVQLGDEENESKQLIALLAQADKMLSKLDKRAKETAEDGGKKKKKKQEKEHDEDDLLAETDASAEAVELYSFQMNVSSKIAKSKHAKALQDGQIFIDRCGEKRGHERCAAEAAAAVLTGVGGAFVRGV